MWKLTQVDNVRASTQNKGGQLIKEAIGALFYLGVISINDKGGGRHIPASPPC